MDVTVAVGTEIRVVSAGDTTVEVAVGSSDVVVAGISGPAGPGVPTGGTTGQVLAKASEDDLDTEWVNQTGGGGGGAVTSVAGRAGAVVLSTSDISGLGSAALVSSSSFDAAGAASAAQTAAQASSLQKTSNLSDLGSASTARTNLGLGGAATLSVGTTTGTVAAGDDSRITGAAQKSSNLSDLGSASTARTNLGLGSLATVTPTGTPDGTKFLRDDGSWAAAAGGASFPLSNTAASSTTAQYSTKVTGDAANRFSVDAAGKHSWGDGTNAADATLARTAAGVLQLGAALDFNSNTLYNASQLAVGTTVQAGVTAKLGRTASATTGQTSLSIADSLTWGSGSFLTYTAVNIAPTLTLNTSFLGVTLFQVAPTLAGSATGYPVIGYAVNVVPPASSALSKYTGMTIGGGRAADTVLTVGLDVGVTNSLAGTTVWAMQVGNYQSYHQGKLTVGGTTAPTWNLHMQGGNSAANGIGIDVSTTGPTAPGSSAAGVISVYKGATNWYLLVTFNAAGTTRYRYMQLNGTTATWTHGTTLPT